MASGLKATAWKNGLRQVVLSRPEQKNALTLSLLQELQTNLDTWDKDAESGVIVLENEGPAFCANAGASTKKEFIEALHTKYTLLHRMHQQEIPAIAMMNGQVEGDGAALAATAQYRIATENTTLALPATMKGMFPDAGTTYFLNQVKADGEPDMALAMYLALTGETLSAGDCYYANLATHYVPTSNDETLKKAFEIVDWKTVLGVEIALDTFFEAFHDDPEASALSDNIGVIRKCFMKPENVDHVMARLAAEGSAWSKATADKLHKACPVALNVAFEQMKRGRKMSLKEAFEMEYALALRYLQADCGINFEQGLQGLDNWSPNSLQEVDHPLVASLLAPYSSDLNAPALDLPEPPQVDAADEDDAF